MALTCRRDYTKAASTQCPVEITSALQKCINDDLEEKGCGGLKIQITTINTTAITRVWRVEACFLAHPIVNFPTRQTSLDDKDKQWDQSDPLVLYFNRNMSKAPLNGVSSRTTNTTGKRDTDVTTTDFTGKKDPLEQSKMKIDEWLNYMVALRKSVCHCSGTSSSCAAYEVNQDPDAPNFNKYGRVNYWCMVDKHSKEPCKVREPGSRHQVTLKKLPDKSENYWTEDLCQQREDPEEGVKEEPKCSCKFGMGIRADSLETKEGIEKLTKEHRNDKLIGYKCDKWYTTDENRWCIVGFDSACADREEILISGVRKLRVFKSTIPCQKKALPMIIESARQLCRGTEYLFFVGDAMWYCSFPIAFCWVYYFVQTHCNDPHFEFETQWRAGTRDLEEIDDGVFSIEEDVWSSSESSVSYSGDASNGSEEGKKSGEGGHNPSDGAKSNAKETTKKAKKKNKKADDSDDWSD
eukprot:gnl/MRDRNA2_/MRDRNA2_134614_c0_seq1.p1 gnl/MRDRNA2_/MRDRNA2_134614_c0~~gnl/MRDRNA2_/MRDRNA2_134614_c0_seq1.p1  ORF type:complete len:538 (-),score=89.68 gnl/MRDRNA2_/MRDRNA2_134614_c0_seq1:30-1427(-)